MVSKNNSSDPPVRQLIRFSNYSLCITLPKEYMDELGWKQGDRICFSLNIVQKNIILTKQKNPKPSQPPTEVKKIVEEPRKNNNSYTTETFAQPLNEPTIAKENENQLIMPPEIVQSNIDHQDLEPILPLN